MAEIRKLFDRKPLTYEGPFRADELYSIIRRFMRERSYYLLETNSQEDVLPEGKQVIIEMIGMRQFSDYCKGEIKLGVKLLKLNEKVLKVEGHEQKYQVGQVKISMTGQMRTDYRNKWEGSGIQFFFRQISDKFIRRDISEEQASHCQKDCDDLRNEIKSYLNMHRFKFEQDPEKEIEEPEIDETGEASYSPKSEVSGAENQRRVHTIVMLDEKVLLIQRPGEKFWDCLSSTLDDPAEIKEKVVRQLKKVGIDYEMIERIMYGDIVELEDEESKHTVMLHPVLVTLKAEPKVEENKFAWVRLSEIKDYDTSDEIHDVLEKVVP